MYGLLIVDWLKKWREIVATVAIPTKLSNISLSSAEFIEFLFV